MTDKELLYIDDALNHARLFSTKSSTYANSIQDQQLKQFAMELANKQKQIYDALHSLLTNK